MFSVTDCDTRWGPRIYNVVFRMGVIGSGMLGTILSILIAAVLSIVAPLGLPVDGLWERGLEALIAISLFAGTIGALTDTLIYHLADVGPQLVQLDQLASLVFRKLYVLQGFLWQWLMDSLVSAASSWTILVARMLNTARQGCWETIYA